MKISSFRIVPRQGTRKRLRGSLTLEFAIICPFLIWVTFAIVEYGLALNSINTISQLARDGARYAAIHATETTCYGADTVSGSLAQYVETESKATSINITSSNVATAVIPGQVNTSGAFVAGSPATPGQAVAVKITYNLSNRLYGSSFVPGLSALDGNVSRISQFVIEKPQGLD